MSDLALLCKPFADRLVHKNPSGGGQYVKHSVVNQKLLMVVGPFDFELVQIIRGHVAAIAPNPDGKSQRAREGRPALEDSVVAVIARLRLTVDGIPMVLEEAGEVEEPHNWPHDGSRLKDAMSDAFKRCAMRAGVGLHMWAQEDFIIREDIVDAAVARRTRAPHGAQLASEAAHDNDTGPDNGRVLIGNQPDGTGPVSTS
jgi:hypothetical protein